MMTCVTLIIPFVTGKISICPEEKETFQYVWMIVMNIKESHKNCMVMTLIEGIIKTSKTPLARTKCLGRVITGDT